MKEQIWTIVERLALDQERARRSLNLTPSENVLSPLARIPFVLDAYSRYFFDHLRMFGAWAFYGGISLGEIELEMLVPLLSDMAGADYVNVKPISGLNCMTVAMAALCPPGGVMLTVPVDYGGHISTAGVAKRLGIEVLELPMQDHRGLDVDRLAAVLEASRPDLIYIDQSSQLFPIDPQPIRALVDDLSPETTIHFDSSHVNGLVLGDALFNPLRRGAHTFGGSTHKTLPGPHKGFLATNDEDLFRRINEMADLFVSHHHLAEVISLTITLLEMKHCGGSTYARRIINNAQVFARALHKRGVAVADSDHGYTACHQVWVDVDATDNAVNVTDRLFNGGLVVNRLDWLPGLPGAALRLSVAEVTRLGATHAEMTALADVFAQVIVDDAPADAILHRVDALRRRMDRPRFCYSLDDLYGAALSEGIVNVIQACTVVTTFGSVGDASLGAPPGRGGEGGGT